MKDFLGILNEVLDIAEQSIASNESPFAAAIMMDEKLIFSGNKSQTCKNPIYHAEISCINEFCKSFDYHLLDNCIMFTSCEPCLMCFHAIYTAGIRHIVYAASIEDAIQYGSGDELIHIREYAQKMNMDIKIDGPFLRDRACNIFQSSIARTGTI